MENAVTIDRPRSALQHGHLFATSGQVCAGFDGKRLVWSKAINEKVDVIVHRARFVLLQVRDRSLSVVHFQFIERKGFWFPRLLASQEARKIPAALLVSHQFNRWVAELDASDLNFFV